MHRILIVEDHPDTLAWLGEIARLALPGSVVVEATTRAQGLERCAEASAGEGTEERGNFVMALVDLRLPDGSGLAVVRELRAKSPETLCVVTTVLDDDANIVTALSSGAHGYLLKDQPRELMARQLAQAREGIPALSPPVARRIMEHFRLTGPCQEVEAKLTPRELDVLGLIARGLRITDAACALGVAEATVASHIKAIYRKLDIGSRAEAAVHAARMGLLSSGGTGMR